MKYIALFLGISLLLFGCLDYFRFEPAGPPQEINTTPGPTHPTQCIDTTPANSCSSTKPMYCTASGALISDPAYCGCPSGTVLRGDECAPFCSDNTAPDSCSANKPMYCTHNSTLIEKASVCGCPTGATRSGDTCISKCTDGTEASQCSDNKPMYCSATLSLIEDPYRCGCPPGTVIIEGHCAAAKCVDGTPAGECAATAPNFCDENLQIVSNPGECGCNYGRIATPDGRNCVSPRSYSYREDNDFYPATGVKMYVRNSEHIECENADYILLDLSITNEGAEPISFSEEEFPALQLFSGSGYKWLAVEYPVNDSECSEAAKFAWNTQIQPRTRAAGIVWYRLLNWESGASYYIYYSAQNQAYAVRLHP